MELRSRSRSTTPFQTQNLIEAESFEGSNHVSVTKSTRRTVTVRNTTGGEVTSSTEGFYTKDAKPTAKIKSGKVSRNAVLKTSDYSSEEGEIESVTHISDNQRNQIIEDAKRAANGTAEISALNLYRKAGRYWDKYPKTDYTYSPHSRDRVEIAPGVVQMPNMSRRTIHSYDSSTNTEPYVRSQYRKLFWSKNNNDEVDRSFEITRKSSRSTITTIFTSIFTFVYWCFYTTYSSVNSSTIYLMKKLHHLSSRLMLLDTWLLRKSTGGRWTKALVALCLLPLVLFAAWFLLSSLGSALYSAYFSPSLLPIKDQEQVLVEDKLQHPPQSGSSGFHSENIFDHINTDEIVEKILQSPKIYNIINTYHNKVQIEQQSSKDREDEFQNIITQLKDEIHNIKQDLTLLQQTSNADLKKVASQIRTENIALLSHRMNRCCNRPVINLEPHIRTILGNLLNDPDFLSTQKGLSDWLHTLFLAKQELEGRLSNLTVHLNKNYRVSIEDTADQVMEKVVTRLSNQRFDWNSVTEEQIKRVVRASLRVYDADKTGLVDYAMEPGGGQILTTRCTESYHSGTAVYSVLGIPLWYPTQSPRIAINPGINPGECWAFQNFPGFLVIKLSGRIRVEAFSVEHVSRLLVPEGRIDSAPKEFEVYGLQSENEKEPVLIGEYLYDYDGDSIQFFQAQHQGLVFEIIEVRIKSNYGNPNYTCLYRFRVHGTVSKDLT